MVVGDRYDLNKLARTAIKLSSCMMTLTVIDDDDDDDDEARQWRLGVEIRERNVTSALVNRQSEDKAFVVDNNGWNPQRRVIVKRGLIDATQCHRGFYIMHYAETRKRETQKKVQGSCLFWTIACVVYGIAAIEFLHSEQSLRGVDSRRDQPSPLLRGSLARRQRR